MLRKDITGQVFNWLTVDHYVGSKSVGKANSSRSVWDCVCICGNHVQTTTLALTTGAIKSCGCKKKLESRKRIKNEVGNTYNYLFVKEMLDEKGKDRRTLFLCECLLCGKECTVSGKALRSGKTKSCGCLKEDYMKKLGSKTFKDLTGQIIENLLVESRAPSKRSAAGNSMVMWNCKCLLCGGSTTVAASALWGGHTKSCGCMHMSAAEQVINNELIKLNVQYIYDYSFSDLISPNSSLPLRFDFALFRNDSLLGLIEYQGEQHFICARNGFGSFQKDVTDPIKREYCKKRNIPLYEINYDSDILKELHRILSEIYNTSYDNTVPSE